MTKALFILAFMLICTGMLYWFIPLKTFNFVIPKDSGSKLLAVNFAYGSDPQQRLDIYEPKQKTGILPVLIFVHGGSWQEGNRADYEFVGRAFAAKGYLTAVISYRAQPRYAYPAFIEDVALATKWLVQNCTDYGGDARNIFIVGHSAGAYDAAMAVLDQNYMRAAGVSADTIKAVASLAGPFDFLPLDTEVTKETFGHLDNLDATQPINFAHKDAPPFLLLHGTADTTVYPRNSVALLKHLQLAGAKAQLIEYQGETHVGILLAIAKPLRKRAPVLADIDKFFKDILQQLPTPDHSE